MSRPRAYQLIGAAEVTASLSTTVDTPPNERQARELVPLKADEREVVAAWREAKDAAAAEGKQLSAKVVRNAVQGRVERIKRERQAEERRRSPIEAATSDGEIAIHHGDFRDVLAVEDVAGSTVITDPPYPREFLPEWSDFAQATLDAGCELLVVMCGQTILLEAVEAIGAARTLPVTADADAERWIYRWCGAYLTIGPATRVWGANVGTSWKPILVFDRGGDRDFLTTDLFRSTGDDKQHHHWGQNENGIAALVEAFTQPGDLIVDPFLGGGTTAIIARELGRRFIGCDIDATAVESSRARLAA